MDKESSRGIGMRLLALRQNNQSYLFWPLSLGQGCCWKITLGRALQWDALASSPILQTLIIYYYTHTHICTHFPSPDPPPSSLWTTSLTGGSVASAENGCGTGWLPAGAGLLPLLQVVCLWFMCFLLLRCFSCSHTVLPKEHSLGIIFLLTFLLLCCNFLQFPVFLSCLHPCHICMLCMYGQVDGLFHWYLWLSDNKGLLLYYIILKSM